MAIYLVFYRVEQYHTMLLRPPDLGRFKRANTRWTGAEEALLFGLIHLRYIERSIAAPLLVPNEAGTDVPIETRIDLPRPVGDAIYS